MTVTQLGQVMPASEFAKWQVYYGRIGQRKQLAAARR